MNFRNLIIIHLVIAVFVQLSPFFTTIHALITFSLGLFWALTDKNSYRPVLIIFYLTGAELLWRGFGASLFWEFGKYSTSIIMMILIYRYGLNRINNKYGFYFILLLLPSFIVLDQFLRQDIAHAIAGPISLGLAITTFSNQNIFIDKLKIYLQALILPIISLFILMLYSTIEHGQIDIYAAYVKEFTTAGIGPNQASNILGLGVFICFLLYFLDLSKRRYYFIIGFLMLIQTVITHSRGGFWNVLIASFIAGVFLISVRKNRFNYVFSGLIFSWILYFFIFPKIDDYAGGSLSNRYTDTDLSQRGLIMITELDAFNKNPLFGIGPGASRKYRLQHFNSPKHTHTEYTRLLAEHGIFGIIYIFLFVIMIFKIFKQNYGLSRSISLSLATWSLLFMFHSATRLAAPSIIFGFASAKYNLKPEDEIKH